jgi:hypothetical protein
MVHRLPPAFRNDPRWAPRRSAKVAPAPGPASQRRSGWPAVVLAPAGCSVHRAGSLDCPRGPGQRASAGSPLGKNTDDGELLAFLAGILAFAIPVRGPWHAVADCMGWAGNADAVPDGGGDRYADAVPDGDGDGYADAVPDGDGDGYADALPDGDGDRYTSAVPDGDGDGYADALPDGDGYTNADGACAGTCRAFTG